MESIVLIGIAIFLFVIGIIFVLRGYRSSGQDSSVIPISDINEIKNLEGSSGEGKKKKDPKALARQAAKESLRMARIQQNNPNFNQPALKLDSGEDAQEVIYKLKQEVRDLRDAIDREIQERETKSLTDEQKGRLEQHQKEFSLAQKSLENLTKENLAFQKESTDQKEKIAKLNQELTTIREDQTSHREQIEKSVNDIKMEKQDLIIRMKESEEKVIALKDELGNLSKQSEEKLIKASETVATLRKQLEDIGQNQQSEVSKQLTQAMVSLEELKQEREKLSHLNDQLDTNLKKVSQFNTHLLEKEKLLEYELTKSRAQALGLEKICEDFKVQIEGMNKTSSTK